MKTCAQCGLENPSSALHCMGCGTLLVEKEKLTEDQNLHNKNKELEKENELLKAKIDALTNTIQQLAESNASAKGITSPIEQKKGNFWNKIIINWKKIIITCIILIVTYVIVVVVIFAHFHIIWGDLEKSPLALFI